MGTSSHVPRWTGDAPWLRGRRGGLRAPDRRLQRRARGADAVPGHRHHPRPGPGGHRAGRLGAPPRRPDRSPAGGERGPVVGRVLRTGRRDAVRPARLRLRALLRRRLRLPHAHLSRSAAGSLGPRRPRPLGGRLRGALGVPVVRRVQLHRDGQPGRPGPERPAVRGPAGRDQLGHRRRPPSVSRRWRCCDCGGRGRWAAGSCDLSSPLVRLQPSWRRTTPSSWSCSCAPAKGC